MRLTSFSDVTREGVWCTPECPAYKIRSKCQACPHTQVLVFLATMTVTSAFAHFAQSVVGIGSSLVNAILAIFQAFLALGQEVLTSAFKLIQAVAVLATDLVQDTLGFVFGGSTMYLYVTLL